MSNSEKSLICTFKDKEKNKITVEDNLPLVHSCVRKLMRSGYEYEDLVQIGSIGLIKAVERFNPSYGVRFSTYAVPLIMGEIKRYIRDNSMVKVSRTYKELWSKAVAVRQKLTAKLGREPRMSEIAVECECSLESLTVAMEASMPCESLSRQVKTGDDDERCLMDTIKSSFDVDTEIEKIALRNAISGLSERERKIIILRYFRGKTQTEVSHEIGVSQVQISRIEKRIMERLKDSLK